jgi:hypothetical protein
MAKKTSKITFIEHRLKHDCEMFSKKMIENTPGIPAKLQQFCQSYGDEGPEWCDEVTKSKFQYLSLLKTKDKDQAKETFLASKETDEHELWKKYASFWDGLSEYEEFTYISRVAQHGRDVQLVNSTWYNSFSEFEEWAAFCLRKTNDPKSEFAMTTSEAKLRDLHKFHYGSERNVSTQELHDFITRLVLDAIECNTQLVSSYLGADNEHFEGLLARMGLNQEDVIKWGADFFSFGTTMFGRSNKPSPRDDDAVDRIADQTLARLHEAQSLKEMVNIFLRILRDDKEFRCEICDFLQVTSSEGKTRIELVETTVDTSVLAEQWKNRPEEALRQLKSKESYWERQGITGSIFVEPKDKTWFHVGTNCLDMHCGQSEEQKSSYEDVYAAALTAGGGKIKNFWLFPIYTDGRLKYGVRVVNKTNPSNPQVLSDGGWTLAKRRKLCEVIKWFGHLMAHTDIASSIISAMPEPRMIERIKQGLSIDWISDSKLSELLLHLKKVPFYRIETRKVSACVVVVHEGSKDAAITAIKGLPPYFDQEKILELSHLFKIYDAMNIDNASLVILDQNLRLLDLRTSVDKSAEIPRFINANDRSVVFTVMPEHPIIQIHHKGEIRGELYLWERTGEWNFRHYDSIRGDIASRAFDPKEIDHRKDILKRVFALAIGLSNHGFGGIIVWGPHHKLKLKEPDFVVQPQRIVGANETSLLNLAKLDGATLISEDGTIQHVNTVISPRESTETLIEAKAKSALGEIYVNRGARHKTGISTSIECPEALVFIISQNRGIMILRNKTMFIYEV